MECRLCREAEPPVSIFDSPQPLVMCIWSCCQLQVEKDDGLPDRICSMCESKLILFSQFKMTCEQSDKIFRGESFENVNVKVEPINMYSEDGRNETFSGVSSLFDFECSDLNDMDKQDFRNGTDDGSSLWETPVSEKSIKKLSRNILMNEIVVKPDIYIDDRSLIAYELETHNNDFGVNFSEVNVNNVEQNCPGNLFEHEIDETTFAVEKTSFSCDTCYDMFDDESDLAHHLETHSCDFECDYCGEVFNQKNLLKYHVITHIGGVPYKCDICMRPFVLKDSLIRHMKVHSGEKLYNCEICSKTFLTKNYVKIHMRFHTGERQHKCDICQKEFYSKGDLNRHTKFHTGEKPHKCEICSKAFYRKSYLVKHLKIHRVDFECDYCGEMFNQKYLLIYHIISHTRDLSSKKLSANSAKLRKRLDFLGNSAHVCDICSKPFVLRKSLNRHKKIHSAEKSYKCDVCLKPFSTRHYLKIHTQFHTGEKPHKCDICTKAFFSKGDLNRHMNIHTGEKLYKCEICKKAFVRKSSLNTHEKSHQRKTSLLLGNNCAKIFY